MLRSSLLAVAGAALVAGLALAEPQVEVRYFSGVPHLQLTGSYPRSHYTIRRATSPEGPFTTAITDRDVLCLGPCYGEDYEAVPGRTYWYRFDLVLQDGSWVSFGPYAVTISPTEARLLGARVFPNPGQGAVRVELHLAGGRGEAPLEVDAALHDLQGRRVRTLWSGPLPRGLTSFTWDGRGGDGRELSPGHYFLRFSSPLGSAVTRVVRMR